MCFYTITLYKYCGHVSFPLRGFCQHVAQAVAENKARSNSKDDETGHTGGKDASPELTLCDASTSMCRSLMHDGCLACRRVPGLAVTFDLRAALEKHKRSLEPDSQELAAVTQVEAQMRRSSRDMEWIDAWLEDGWKQDLELLRAIREEFELASWEDAFDHFKLYEKKLRISHVDIGDSDSDVSKSRSDAVRTSLLT